MEANVTAETWVTPFDTLAESSQLGYLMPKITSFLRRPFSPLDFFSSIHHFVIFGERVSAVIPCTNDSQQCQGNSQKPIAYTGSQPFFTDFF